MGQTILVTGGAGYIGSHTCVELLNAGHTIVCVDNLSNSSPVAIERVQELTGKEIAFHEIDLLDAAGLDGVFAGRRIDAVIHFAGLKAVGEGQAQPLRYYQNNVTGTLVLLDCMKRHGVTDIVFSSSATVYGRAPAPLREDAPIGAEGVYGRTKEMIERILQDLAAAEPNWRIVLLRYFNPVGAHESGRIGEDPRGIPNNLVPYIMQVAVGRLDKIRVFGNDYDTKDGTGVRDYIHVLDLASGHLAALESLPKLKGCRAFNLGTGTGYSVLEMLGAAERAVGKTLAHEVVDRRPGDLAVSYADPTRAKTELNWTAKKTLDDMCQDSWRWQSQNPSGYE